MMDRKKRLPVDWHYRIGIFVTMCSGCKGEVIDYRKIGSKVAEYQVRFTDERNEREYKTWQQWNNIINGTVKSPFHRSVCGVGYLGVDENGEVPTVSVGKGKIRREYTVWANMLGRCYSDKQDERHPSYENCTVCERWHSFANFLEDISSIKNYEYWRDNPQQKIALNKDMYYTELGIDTDCKEYSLETVRFLTNSDNAKEVFMRGK